jgi:hypothetical protein
MLPCRDIGTTVVCSRHIPRTEWYFYRFGDKVLGCCAIDLSMKFVDNNIKQVKDRNLEGIYLLTLLNSSLKSECLRQTP